MNSELAIQNKQGKTVGKYGEKILYIDVQERLSWDVIQKNINGSEAKAIKLLNCSTRDAALAFIEDGCFCKLINASPYVFLLVIEIDKFSNFLESNLDEFNSKIDEFRPIIVQVGSKLENSRQHIYCREPLNKKFTFSQTASEMVDYNTVKDFSLERLLAMLRADNDGEFPQDLLQVSIDNTKSFEWGRYIDYAARYNNSLSARFLTFVAQWSLEEKNERGESVLELAAEFGDAGTISAVLDLPFKKNWSDNDLSEDHKRLLKLENEEKQTPVLIVLGKGLISAFELFDTWGLFLIDNGYEEVVEVLWELKQYDKLAKILKKDAPFPSEFNLGFNHDGIAEIVAERQSFHRAIEEKNVKEVFRFIKLLPNIKKCYNTDGKVALLTALETESYDIYALLKNNEFWKDDSIEPFLNKLDLTKQVEIQKAINKFPVAVNDSHIHGLISNSRFVPLIRKTIFSCKIRRLYTSLDKIPRVSQVLKVINRWDNVDIIFDFQKDSTVNLDLHGSYLSSGSCSYETSTICIGANQSDKKALLGTLAHELTHLAMQIVYNNSCKPYNSMDTEKRTSFDGIVEFFKNNKNCDLIQKVFDNYKDDAWSSELIVRVNHILAEYSGQSQKILENAQLLVNWYDKYVVPDIVCFLEDPNSFKYQNEILEMNKRNGLLENLSELTKEIELESVTNILDLDSMKIIVTDYSKLEYLIIYQVLLRTLTPYIVSRNFLIMQSSDLLNDLTAKNIYSMNKSVDRLKIVIDCTKCDLCENVILKINNLIFKNKIILLAKKEQVPELQHKLKLETHSFIDCGTQYTLENLTEKSKKHILKKTISFQGAPIELCDIIQRESRMGQHLQLKYLLKNEAFVQNESPAQTPSYFVDRTLHTKIVLDKMYRNRILGPDDKLVFSEDDFHSTCNTQPLKNVHLIAEARSADYWVKSKGSISELRKHMKKYWKLRTEQFVLLSDFCLMGKTTLIYELAKRTKKEKSNRWVSVVRLIEHTDTFHNSPNTKFDSAEEAVRFVGENILKLKSPFEKELFRYSCLEEKSLVKVSLFFDCLDEVCPTYYDLVVELITQLRTTVIERLWVTTRPNLVEKLEEAFNTVHYKMIPFAKYEQKMYLYNLWCTMRFSKNNSEKIKCFAREVIDKTAKYFDEEFVGTPLFLNILAEDYKKSVKSYCNASDHPTLKIVVDATKLVERIIDKKIAIYQEETSKFPISNVAAIQRTERERQDILKAHQMFALHPKCEGISEKIQQVANNFSKEEFLRFGLVTVSDGEINFVHRAIAEYFVSRSKKL